CDSCAPGSTGSSPTFPTSGTPPATATCATATG
ncbi:MAG: Glycerophosphoryl diester phosphodiesterase, partial [uncultured Nocardioidaceae bacterium]